MRHDLRPASFLHLLPILLIYAAAASSPALASGDLASISGRVVDTNGGPIAGARVTLSGDKLGPVTVHTSADGTYHFWAVQPGPGIRVAAQADGRRTVEYSGMRIYARERRHVSFRLRKPDEWEVAVLVSRSPFPWSDLVRGFTDGLGIPTHVIDLDGEADPAEAVRHEVAEKPNLILAAGLSAGRLVRDEAKDIPSILTLIPDPRNHDLASPNISFLANNPDPAVVVGKLLAVLPAVRTIGVLYDSESGDLLARDLREAARRRDREVVASPCYDANDVVRALSVMEGRVEALVVPFDPLAAAPGVRETVASWSLAHHMALLAPGADWTQAGALLSFGQAVDQIGTQAQEMARKILQGGGQTGGAVPQFAAAPSLAVNRTTAAALGITIPPGLETDGSAQQPPASR